MDNMMMKQGLSTQQLMMVDAEVNRKKKSKVVAFILWLFLGAIGGHRYYMGDTGYAVGMTLTLGGFGLWALIDAFFISKRIDLKTQQLELEVIKNTKLMNI